MKLLFVREILMINFRHLQGGKWRSKRGNGQAVAFVDSASIIDSSGNHTIRRIDCDLIISDSSIRCDSCKSFRKTLRSTLSRHKQKSHESTSASSQAKYCTLTSEEKNKKDEKPSSISEVVRAAN